MEVRNILIAVAAFSLCSCAGMMTTTTVGGFPMTYVGVYCERAINYQTGVLSVQGIEVPVEVSGATQTVKVGNIVLKQESIRDASDLVKSIDLAQYATCQDMLQMKNEDNKMKLSQQRQQLLLALANITTGLRDAKTEEQYQKAIEDGKTRKNAIVGQ